MHPESAELLDFLTKLRKKSGESQTDLAEAMGVRQPTVSSWEKAKHSPPLWQTIEWAQRYGYNLELVPAGDARHQKMRSVLAIIAALDESKLDNILALARLTRDIPVDVSDSAISFMETVAGAVVSKSA